MLKNEKYGVCQNIKTFLTGVERCRNSDVAKYECFLSKINSALNTASDIQASIDSKRKELFSADYTLKSYTSDEPIWRKPKRNLLRCMKNFSRPLAS